MGDRTLYVPSHLGRNVLPNLPFFHKLLRYAQRKPSRTAVRDINAGLEKTYHDVLSDALALRVELEKMMSQKTRRDLSEDKEVYIGLLAPGGYEYTVGFIAILAMGAAVVPMGELDPGCDTKIKLTLYSCWSTGRGSFLLSPQGPMCGFGGQHYKRSARPVHRSIHGGEEKLPHSLSIPHRIVLPLYTHLGGGCHYLVKPNA